MTDENKKRTASFLEKLKQKATTQQHYGGDMQDEEAKMDIRDCPNCGAGRAYHKGLTQCAYCGFEFMNITLTDGIHIKKENNS